VKSTAYPDTQPARPVGKAASTEGHYPWAKHMKANRASKKETQVYQSLISTKRRKRDNAPTSGLPCERITPNSLCGRDERFGADLPLTPNTDSCNRQVFKLVNVDTLASRYRGTVLH
jgi:hypothetical protein